MRDIAHGQGFVEVADRCWVARHAHLDVNVGLIGGERGLVLVDSLASTRAAREMVGQARRLGAGEVVAVVNTHHHFDHTFGNAAVMEEYGAVPLLAHETVPADLLARAAGVQQQAAADPSVPEHADIAATTVLAPDDLFSSARAIDLGDRLVEAVHPGRGHTAGDVVVRVGDADLLFAGDLVEESAERQGVPGFGDDCYPLEWPATLELVVGLLTPASVVVPGHGLPVDLEFVSEQRSAIGVVAETVRELAGRGVPVTEALAAAEWPYPAEELRDAVRRGYAHLPRGARSLPMA
jgi:glyoxylase-like metal-dependent hydrolase (beta-lactamase superfamily II)